MTSEDKNNRKNKTEIIIFKEIHKKIVQANSCDVSFASKSHLKKCIPWLNLSEISISIKYHFKVYKNIKRGIQVLYYIR